MLSLQWRLQALDPDASESLRVISFFDALSESHAGIEALLRAAALLVEATVGVRECGTRSGVYADPAGVTHRGTVDLTEHAITRPVSTQPPREVFLVRDDGSENANDELVSERLALSVLHAFERLSEPSTRPSIDVLLDGGSSDAERAAALSRLRVDATSSVRVVASPFDVAASRTPRAGVVFTPVGMLRAEVVEELGEYKRAGIGLAVPASEMTASWRTALTSLRLSTPRQPVVRADDYGSLLLLDQISSPSPVVDTMSRLFEAFAWARDTVEVLGQSPGAREAARELGVHHSTVQWRVGVLQKELGYDVTRGHGTTRLAMSFSLFLLATQRF